MFIVTLAATGTVTLAARAAGMSRKAAYALRKRDPMFAAAWDAARGAAACRPGDRAEGDAGASAAPSTSSSRVPARGEAWASHLPASHRPSLFPIPSGPDSLLARRLAGLARHGPGK